MDASALRRSLAARTDPPHQELRVVVRQATDLADSGRYLRDTGSELTVSLVLEHLGDAPTGPLVGQWNWWIGSLEAAYGGYDVHAIVRYDIG
jgi:hypothetical protein